MFKYICIEALLASCVFFISHYIKYKFLHKFLAEKRKTIRPFIG